MTSQPPAGRAPLAVGIVGTGWGARTQAPLFRRAGLPVVAFWGRSLARARAAAETHATPFATDDWRALVERPEVDLVSIVTPPHTHCEIALAALAAGKHVLCEKPTALDAGEAEAMAARARETPGRLALIDHELRFLPAVRRMRELLLEGAAGELWTVEGSWSGAGRLDPDWPWSWWSDSARGGGILGAVGSHLLDALQWLTGRGVERVAAVLGRGLTERRDGSGAERAVTSDDWAAVLLGLEGGVPGTLRLSAIAAGPPAYRLTVAGSAARLTFEGGRLFRCEGRSRAAEELTPPDALTLPAAMPDNPWTRGTAHLAAALHRFALGERDALDGAADFAAGLAVQRVLDAARRAAAGGGLELVSRGAAG